MTLCLKNKKNNKVYRVQATHPVAPKLYHTKYFVWCCSCKLGVEMYDLQLLDNRTKTDNTINIKIDQTTHKHSIDIILPAILFFVFLIIGLYFRKKEKKNKI